MCYTKDHVNNSLSITKITLYFIVLNFQNCSSQKENFQNYLSLTIMIIVS